MAQEGYLTISDITGYTTYLTESELEHARESLTDLLGLLIEHTRSPFTISKLEGDAVLSYAPAAAFTRGQTLLEMTENTYLAFRKALDLMVINTTCTCNACRNLPKLDLKFFLHYGTFTLQQVGNFTELLGLDVNLLHRIMKNHIAEQTGIAAYAAYTSPLVDKLGLAELLPGAPLHKEEFPDVGEVGMLVQNMEGVWEAQREANRIRVTPETADLMIDFEFPVPQPQLWDYITNPEFRAILMGSEGQHLELGSQPRVGAGAVYVCAHGDRLTQQAVLDWRPFDEYTVNSPSEFPETACHLTFKLEPAEEGTRLVVLWGDFTGPHVEEFIARKPMWLEMVPKWADSARQRLLQDLEKGEVAYYPKIEMTREEFQASVAESLSSNA